jgi:predicted ArsR family transcriptional regulator
MTKLGMQRSAWNRRLLASTRGRILVLLRDEHRTVKELAAALRLTGNAVRAHLLRLERDGLVQQFGIRRGRRKPHLAYGLTSEAESVFPKAYGPLLDQIVTVLSERLPTRLLNAIMRQTGRELARPHLAEINPENTRERVKIALNILKELGGSARLDEINGKQMIHGRNGCPLAAVTANHPEACLIVEAMLHKVVGKPVKTCCRHGEIPHCCFEVGR